MDTIKEDFMKRQVTSEMISIGDYLWIDKTLKTGNVRRSKHEKQSSNNKRIKPYSETPQAFGYWLQAIEG